MLVKIQSNKNIFKIKDMSRNGTTIYIVFTKVDIYLQFLCPHKGKKKKKTREKRDDDGNSHKEHGF